MLQLGASTWSFDNGYHKDSLAFTIEKQIVTSNIIIELNKIYIVHDQYWYVVICHQSGFDHFFFRIILHTICDIQ